ncbi:MAG: amino acid adenylation domain-containing protein, partial [Thermoanaerobaculia bacterium]|nr:amino acid adenylation domain-containing protein [Thermoanaerobaculia bacterium]
EAALEAARNESGPAASAELVVWPGDGPFPLSFGQERLWFLDRFAPGDPLYNQPAALRLRGRLDRAALVACLAQLVDRHAGLRTTFGELDGVPFQQIGPVLGERGLTLDEIAVGSEAELAAAVAEHARTRFDLERGPVYTFRLVRLGGDDHVLLLNIHHIAFDGGSVAIFVAELSRLYAGAVTGEPVVLPPVPLRYPDFAQWQRTELAGAVLAAELGFWRRVLAEPPVLELPTDRPRPALRRGVGGLVPVTLDPATSERLRAAARAAEVTPFQFLLAVFGALLGRLAGQDDVIVGAPVAGRERRELEGVLGFFVNTLPIRIDLSGEPTGAELLARVGAAALDTYAHPRLPFERLVDELAVPRDPARTPLVSALFSYEVRDWRFALPGLEVEILPPSGGGAKFDLSLGLVEDGGTIAGNLEYDSDLFERTTIERWAAAFETLTGAWVRSPESPVASLVGAGPAEAAQLRAWSGVEGLAPAAPGLLHERIVAQARRSPTTLALAGPAGELSYGELLARAEGLAGALQNHGAGPERAVAVALRDPVEALVAMLAVWLSGAAFVPLDPDQPAGRTADMLADVGAVALVATEELPVAADLRVGRAFEVPRVAPSARFAFRPVQQHPESLAWVIFTSGTTGRPKGVGVPHRAVVNHLLSAQTVFGWTAADRILQAGALTFDLTLEQIISAWSVGATLIPLGFTAPPLDRLTRVIRDENVSVLNLATGLWASWVAEARPEDVGGHALRQVVIGGEAVPPAALARSLALLPAVSHWNAYGPTETTITSTAWNVVGTSDEFVTRPRVPIGRALPADTVAVVDRAGRSVPLGAVGELVIGGHTLARGYLGDPARTAERFVPDPESSEPGARRYRTGDRVRFTGSGDLEFLGRLDQQVKLRGYRLEPGEIEAVLAAHPGVGEAAVVAADGRLVAFVTAPASALDVADVLRHARSHLPAALVPAEIVVLATLPRTAGGKLDRKALVVERPSGASAPAVAPRTPTEARVAELFAEVLEAPAVDVETSFFALGGHSLLALRLLSRLRREWGVEVGLPELFANPTVAGVASLLAAAGAGATGPERGPALDRARLAALVAARKGDPGGERPIPPRPGDGPFPLSFAQERLWFLDRYEPGSAQYNVPGALRLFGRADLAALARALNRVVERQTSLRTVFRQEGEEAVQRIRPAAPQPLPVVDLASLPPARREAALAAVLEAQARLSFDLESGPVLRTGWVRLGPAEGVLYATMHHIVSDGWSLDVFLRELAELYRAEVAGTSAALPDLPLRYADFAVWQREVLAPSGRIEKQIEHWRTVLAGAPKLTLPTDHPRPAVRSSAGATVEVHFPEPLAAAFRAFAATRTLTAFNVSGAAFAAFLGRYAGQATVVLGTPLAGRSKIELENLVGFFVNTLPLAVELDPAAGFVAVSEAWRAATLAAFAHQDVPFERLVEALVNRRDPSRTPLFEVAFAFQPPSPRPTMAGLVAEPVVARTATAKFDLTCVLTDDGREIAGTLEYATALFERVTMERFARSLEIFLAAALAAPDRPVGSLPLLAPAEARAVLGEWSGAGTTAYPRDASLVELFCHQAALRPDAPALDYPGFAASYGELAARVRALAAVLRQRGVGPWTPVALLLPRSPEMVVATLAVLAAGGTYVPLDADHPVSRLAFQVADTQAELVLHAGVDASLEALLAARPELVALDLATFDFATPGDAVTAGVGPLDPAAVMYTSGSTGTPKGVVIPHRGVVRLVLGSRDVVIRPEDRVAQVANPAFDATTFELFSALLNGACLVGISKDVALDTDRMAAELAARRVSVMLLTTALFNQLAKAHPEAVGRLRHAFFGGEAADPAAVAQVLAAGAPERFTNAYGPTENAVITTAAALAGRDPARLGPQVPIGRPISNTTVYLVDRRLVPVAVGAVGELVTGGDGLALGYVGRPAQTAERFVPDPFSATPGARLYRTGDLARFAADGEIEFVGRADGQVKIRGFRIEPGEIEAVLLRHPEVAQGALLVRTGGDGEKRLVAFVAARPGHELVAANLRAWLRERLPDYLVPSGLEVLAELPLTSNGKVDRRVLAERELGATSEAEFVAPANATEELVAGVFAEILELPRVSVHDDFFALGGHSLKATRLVSRLRAASGVEVPLRNLFETPTVAGLAEFIAARVAPPTAAPAPASDRTLDRTRLAALIAARKKAGGDRPFPRLEGDGPFELSFAQSRLWFLDRLYPGSAQYNVPAGLRLHGPLDIAALAGALADVVRRHETLRTRFAAGPQGPMQWLTPVPEDLLEVVDLQGLPAGDRLAEAERQAGRLATLPFDLASGRLLRALLLVLGPEDHGLVVVQHHIASDGWSLGLFLTDLAALYEARAAGREAQLPPLPVRYVEFAAWQRAELAAHLDERLSFWRQALAGAPPLLALPTDRPRPLTASGRGGEVPCRFDGSVLSTARSLAQERGATLFMVLLAVWQNLLARHAGQDDVVVGSPVAGRLRPELEGLVGFFVNTVAFRGRFDGDPSLVTALARTKEVALGAFAHQDLPFERLVEDLAPDRAASHPPIFQVVFALQNAPLAPAFPGVQVSPLIPSSATAKFDLMFALREADGGLVGTLEFDRDLFDAATAERLLAHFGTLLPAALARPAASLSELPWFPESERRQVLTEWNRTTVEIPAEPIHRLFEAQVRARPEALAVRSESVSLTYAELDRRADHVAAELVRRGVGPEVAVALALERSVENIVATLGVLKAGGFFVPLDAGYPAERLRFMLEDAGARVLLAHESLLAKLPAERPETWLVGADLGVVGDSAGLKAGRYPGSGRSSVRPDHLAYVMYTSGSTGKPKGVAVPHRAVVRLVTEPNFVTLGPGETVLQLAPTSFDAATLEIWGALLTGGTLAVPAAGSLSLGEIAAALDHFEVTTLWLTAGLFHQMAEHEGAALSRVRQVLAGGDVLAPAAVERVVAALAPGAVLVNGYGPTENTTFTACHVMASAADVARPVPVGRPITNTRALVLDAELRPVPVDVPGELYAAGLGLARGYLGRAGLTAERFVPNPVAEIPGDRLYRTGDQVRWRPDGSLEFLGRLDGQVKLRGFRIELGEIEAVLGAHPAVATAAAVVADGRLFAFVTAAPGVAELPISELESKARVELPAFMVPAAFVPLAELPLNANGKVDKKALATRAAGVAQEVAARLEFVAPRSAIEAVVAGAFAAVLGLDAVSVEADFFELGGHSLLATQLVSRLREALGVELPLRAVFEAPTPAGLAARLPASVPGTAVVDGQSAGMSPVAGTSEDELAPLSFAQERLWFLDRFEPGSTAYHVPVVLDAEGPLDPDRFAAAVRITTARHEILRTVYLETEAGPRQRVLAEVPAPRVVDLSDLPEAERAAAAAVVEAEFRAETFDLAHGPVLHAVLLILESRRHTFLLNVHHIAADGWSVGVFVRDLVEAYRALERSEDPRWPELPTSYRQFAQDQRQRLSGAELEAQLGYWRTRLAAVPPLELPTDRPRPALRRRPLGGHERRLGRELAAALQSFAREHQATLFMVLLANFEALLARLSGQQDFAVGTPIANRHRGEIENLVGLFVNTLALRSEVPGATSFRDLVVRVRESTLDAYAHQELPFERLVDEVAPERSLDRTPVFQVFFTLQNASASVPQIGDVSFVSRRQTAATIKFDWVVTASEQPDGEIELLFDHDAELFDAATAEAWSAAFETQLVAALATPEVPLEHLALVTPAVAAALGQRGLGPAPVPAADAALHELVFAHRDLAAPALEDARGALSYGQLERRSAALARQLVAAGVGLESRVGLALPRGVDLGLAAVAVLRAGGAYVPLDLELPAERLRHLVTDAGVGLVVTAGDDLPPALAGLPRLDLLQDAPEDLAVTLPAVPAAAAAYVIYTSGSTGRPKGVVVPHRAITRHLLWFVREFGFAAETRVLQKTPASFDASVWELFAPLVAGGVVVFAEPAAERDPERLLALVSAARITTLQAVPTLWRLLLGAEARATLGSLRQLFVGGEAFDAALAAVLAAAAPEAEIVNLYGPTETTVQALFARLDGPVTAATVPIGRPVAGTRVALEDALGRPLPVGFVGELLVGGDQVARGYLGRPALTAERFVPDPDSPEPGARRYRTGDLVRLRAEGRFEYRGRTDAQVKLRGFRIELEEIAAVLAEHPAVAAAAVAVVPGPGGEDRLVAFVTLPGRTEGSPSLLVSGRPSGRPHTEPTEALRSFL